MRKDNDEPSEFEVQAEAYINIRKRFTHVRGEYHFRYGARLKRAARFDIVILSPKGELKLIIEVKKKSRPNSWHQAKKYGAMTGLPILYIRGINQAKEAASIVLNELKRWHLGEEYLLT